MWVIVSNMTQPMIGGMQRSAKAGPFFFVQVANAAPPIVAMICTAPKGMLRRIVWKLSKPKPLTINGPKVVIPPLGILRVVSCGARVKRKVTYEMEKINANQNQVLRSSKLS